jgi:hypothetical protein
LSGKQKFIEENWKPPSLSPMLYKNEHRPFFALIKRSDKVIDLLPGRQNKTMPVMKFQITIGEPMMRHRFYTPITILFLLLTTTAMAFAKDKPQTDDCKATTSAASRGEEKLFAGESRKLGNGSIRSWVKLDASCNPTSIGVTFTESALSGLPAEPPPGDFGFSHKLALPPQAAATPFNHISVDWNPKGHEPDHIYSVGHFDFHFYMISPEDRQAIKVQDNDLSKFKKQPSAEFIPEDYIYAPGSEVPGMGAHWVYKNAHEFHGQAFTSTFIYGSYDGHLIFLEPMITKAFLETRPSLTVPVKQAAKVEKPGYYPASYIVKYDPQSGEYTVALVGLSRR